MWYFTLRQCRVVPCRGLAVMAHLDRTEARSSVREPADGISAATQNADFGCSARQLYLRLYQRRGGAKRTTNYSTSLLSKMYAGMSAIEAKADALCSL